MKNLKNGKWENIEGTLLTKKLISAWLFVVFFGVFRQDD